MGRPPDGEAIKATMESTLTQRRAEGDMPLLISPLLSGFDFHSR